MEEETWKAFRKHADLDDASLQSIKDLYFQKMKPVVTEEQRDIFLHLCLEPPQDAEATEIVDFSGSRGPVVRDKEDGAEP